MATYLNRFNCTGGQTYFSSGRKYERRDGFIQGFDPDEDDAGNRRAIMLFNSLDIRQKLANKRVTGCLIDFYVRDLDEWEARIGFGTHNYTSEPDVWSDSRVNQNRVQYQGVTTGQWRNVNLGTTIGNELKDGVATGIALGPAPDGYNDDERYYVELSPASSSNRPVVIITSEDFNTAPGAPTLLEPAAGVVWDANTRGVDLRWQHNDPNNDAQSAWRVQRRRLTAPNTYLTEYWTGTGWSTTVTDLTQSTPGGGLSNGYLRIPAGQWPNGYLWEWTVQTRDASGNWGTSWAPYRQLYASTPPTTSVTEPSGFARTPRPTIRWTFADVDGQPQHAWIVKIVPEDTYLAEDFNPDVHLGHTWMATNTADNRTATAVVPSVDLTNHKKYRAYVRVGSTPNETGGTQYSAWSYSNFEVAVPPSASSMVFPANGSVADLGNGFSMEWRNNHYGNIGSQTAFAIRRQVQNGPYQWWNGSSWVATETYLPSSSTSYAFRPGEIPNGQRYTFSISIRDDYNQVSPYSSGTTVEASSAASVTVLAPAGTTNVTNPTVTWTMFDIENDVQQLWHVKVIVNDVYAAGGAFDPTTATAVWDSTERFEESTRNVEIPTPLVNGETYRAYVRVATNGVYSGWSYAEFTVSIVPPAAPTATTRVIDDEGTIEITIQGRDSILSEGAARGFDDWIDTDHSGDNSNSTVTPGVAFSSSQSLYAVEVRSDGAGTMSAYTGTVWPVAPGMTYTAAATLLAALNHAPVQAYVSIEFFDADQNFIQPFSATPQSDESAIRSVVTAVAPAGAAYAGMRVTFQATPVANATHLFFDPVLRPTTGSEWSPGGTMGETFANVYEVSEDRTIRYGRNVPIPVDTQRVVVRDEEARMGNPMTYAVTIKALYANASLVSAPVELPPVSWSDGLLWISDPLRPGSARAFGVQSYDAIVRPIRQGKFRPIGRPDAVITTGVRGLREGGFTVVTHSREEREAFRDLTERSEILLLRIPPDQYEEIGETIYVRLEGDAPSERPFQQRTRHRTIKQEWTEQRSPDLGWDYVAD
jgi:hypothetical protein